MWRFSPSRVLCAAPGSPGLAPVRTGGIAAAVRSGMSLRQTHSEVPAFAAVPRRSGGAWTPFTLEATMVESVWRQRLRWRLRGAWQWPAFGALTVIDAALVAWLPWTGEGADAIGAFLFAGFVNLVAIAVFAPFVGMALRRRRRDLPFMIARDYAATGLLLCIAAALLVG